MIRLLVIVPLLLGAALPARKDDTRVSPANRKAVTVDGPDFNGLLDALAGRVNVANHCASGTADHTTCLRAALAAATSGQTVFAPGGTYTISDTVSIPSGVTLRGVGDATVFRLSLTDWSPSNTKAAFTMLGVTGAGLRDLKIDGQGASRSESVQLAQTVVLSGASRCLIENVTFYDVGQTASSPSGPALLLASQDVAGDLTDPGPLAVGATTDNVIRNCRFIQTGNAKYGFAIRMLTNWAAKRALADFVNPTARNTVEGCRFEGNWEWNVVEVAGGGTVDNKVTHNFVTGYGLSALDVDKGASYNLVAHNTIQNFKKSVRYVGDFTKRFIALNDHGFAADYVNAGNVFTGNILRSIDANGDPVNWASAMGIEYARGSSFSRNTLDGMVNAGGSAYAFYLGLGVESSAIEGNTLLSAKHGIWSNTTDTTSSRIRIVGNEVSATDRALSLEPAGAVASVEVANNLLKTSDTAKIVAVLGANLTAPIFASNSVTGGAESVRVGSVRALLQGNVFQGAAGRSIRIAAGATLPVLQGNTSLSPGINDMVVEATADEPTLLGNAFSHPLTQAKGPRVVYGAAAPVAGTWGVNDRVIHSAPAVGQPKAWICTIAGTPGTWVSEGNL